MSAKPEFIVVPTGDEMIIPNPDRVDDRTYIISPEDLEVHRGFAIGILSICLLIGPVYAIGTIGAHVIGNAIAPVEQIQR